MPGAGDLIRAKDDEATASVGPSAPALVVELDELLPKGSLVGVVVDETFDLSHGLNWSGTQANLPGGRKSSRDALPNTHEYHIDPFPPGCRGFIRPPGRPRR
jgi:hypothetical protein